MELRYLIPGMYRVAQLSPAWSWEGGGDGLPARASVSNPGLAALSERRAEHEESKGSNMMSANPTTKTFFI